MTISYTAIFGYSIPMTNSIYNLFNHFATTTNTHILTNG